MGGESGNARDARSATTVPPKPSHAGSILATAVLMGVWLLLTFGAGAITPTIAAVVEYGEVAVGADVLPGSPDEDPDAGDNE